MRPMTIVAAAAALIVCGCSRTERVASHGREPACRVEFWPVGTGRCGPADAFRTDDVKFEGDRAVFTDSDTGLVVSLPSAGVVVTMRAEHSAK